MAQQLLLRQYGVDSVRWVIKHPYSGLFLPPGLGKTAITLLAFKCLKDNNAIDKLFVIAPLRVATIVWPAEVKKWEPFCNMSVGILHGPNKDIVLQQNHDIYVINPDGLAWFSNKKLPGKNKRWMLVCDESTLFKNHSSQRFKILRKWLPVFDRRVILTGTPVPNGLLQLWPQIYILDTGKRLGRFFTAYRNKFFYPSGWMGWSYNIVQGAQEEIYRLVDDIVLHKSNDELDLPPIVYNTINIRLDKASQKMYNDMKRHYVAEYGEDGLAIAANAAVAAGKLKQISNGNMYDQDKNVVEIHKEKIGVLQDVVDGLSGRPLLIMYEFNHDLKALQKAFPGAPHIGGGVNPKTLANSIDMWNKGQLPVMFLQPQSGGHGLNLQDGGCHDVVWMSIPFDLELYEQANKRVHRQGVKNSVTIHHIVTIGTVDENIMKVLEKKESLQSSLLSAMLK